MRKYIILICAALLVTSCIDFTAPERFTEQSYFLTGILKAGKTVDFEDPVIVGKTTSVEDVSFGDFFINGAEVTLFEMDNTGTILDSINLSCIPIPLLEDTLFIYVDINAYLLIKPELTYRIEAKIDTTDILWAETTVPKTISVQPDPGYTADPTISGWPEMIFGDIDLEHPIMIETQDNNTFNLHCEFYCLEDWDDAEYIFAMEEDTYPEDPEEYESEADGSPRRTSTFYIFQPSDNLINFSFYQYAFNFYGRYEVNVSSIDDNFLNYLYKPEGYNHGGI
ncbi:MAG: DUF4249 family protein, partial [Candidatus Cloacimonetes bacterium]|nr:DUF4249 family protein [Candidatus Cloacimonadota bacterium]